MRKIPFFLSFCLILQVELCAQSSICGSVSPCDLVQNGGFENNSGCGSTSSTSTLASCWLATSLSPDIFVRGCTSSTPPANLGTNTYSSTIVFDSFNGSPNNSIIGMGALAEGSDLSLSESIANYLGSPVLNNHAYTLSFWAYQYVGAKCDPDYFSSGTYPSQNFNNSSVCAVLSFATHSLFLPSSSQTYPFQGLTTIKSVTLANAFNTWKHYTITFTTTAINSGNWLYIGMDKNLTFTNLVNALGNSVFDYLFYTLLDDVSLRPASVAPHLNFPSQICSGQSLMNLGQYVNTTGGNFSGPGITSTLVGTTTQFNFNASQTMTNGIYTIVYTYTDQTNCVQTAIQQVMIGNVNNGIKLAQSSSTNCVNTGTLSIISPSANTSYTWQPGNFVGTTYTINPSVITNYTVSSANGNTCTFSGAVNVWPNIPYVQFNAITQPVCPGSPLQISATGNYTSIVWQPGNFTTSILNVFSPLSTISYSAFITSSLGCTGTAVKTVSVVPYSINISISSPSICSGQSTTLTAHGGTNYFWINNFISSSVTVVNPTITTIYTVQGNGTNSCLNIVTATVNVYHPTIINNRSTTICLGESIILSAQSGANTYMWSPANLYAQTISVAPVVTTNYTVYTTSYFSTVPCSSKNSILVTVIPCTGLEELRSISNNFVVFPNPNDGTFSIQSESGELEVKIYNESGQIIKTLILNSDNNKIVVSDLKTGFYFVEAGGKHTKLMVLK